MRTWLKFIHPNFSYALLCFIAVTSASVALNTLAETSVATNTGCMLPGGQTTSIPDTVEKKQAVLRAISEQVKVGKTIAGRFEQRKFIHVLPQPLLSKGSFYLDFDTGLEWSIIEPLTSHMVFDDKGIRQSQNSKQIWQISNDQASVAIIGQLIRAALSFDWPTIDTHFAIDVCSKQYPQIQQWALILTPKDKVLQQAVNRIQLEGDQHLDTLILFEANNDRTEIVFQMP